MLEILETFGSFSGQTINKGKSCVLFSPNTPSSIASAVSSQLGIARTENLGRYLGIPILSGRKGKEDFSFPVDKVRGKLTGWKASNLSQPVRISLAQSCLFNIPNYVMQMCKLPAWVCDYIEKLCRDLIWGSTPEARKNHLISWETICKPKEDGGLCFHSLRMLDEAWMGSRGQKGRFMGSSSTVQIWLW